MSMEDTQSEIGIRLIAAPVDLNSDSSVPVISWRTPLSSRHACLPAAGVVMELFLERVTWVIPFDNQEPRSFHRLSLLCVPGCSSVRRAKNRP